MIKKICSIVILAIFIINSGAYSTAWAARVLPDISLPVRMSSKYTPTIISGLKVQLDNPFKLQFIIENANHIPEKELNDSISKMAKYFLAGLTIPQEEWWVNLSPYEKNRIVPAAFGQTQIGRDLLAQDLWLKQLTAQMMNPRTELGEKFWREVYRQFSDSKLNLAVTINSFNKVWIVPDKAEIYESKGIAFIKRAHLKVLLDEDYVAKKINNQHAQNIISKSNADLKNLISKLILPQIEMEVNEGKNFAPLRQIYHSLILATWYRQKLQQSILSKVYVDQTKVKGLADNSKDQKIDVDKIYKQYLLAFKKGAYSLIKDDIDPITQQSITRKYFSGGTNFNGLEVTSSAFPAKAMLSKFSPLKLATVVLVGASNVGLLEQAHGFSWLLGKWLDGQPVSYQMSPKDTFSLSFNQQLVTLDQNPSQYFDGSLLLSNQNIGSYKIFSDQDNHILKLRLNGDKAADYYYGYFSSTNQIQYFGENKNIAALNIDEKKGWTAVLGIIDHASQDLESISKQNEALRQASLSLPFSELYVTKKTNGQSVLQLSLSPNVGPSPFAVMVKVNAPSFPELLHRLTNEINSGRYIFLTQLGDTVTDLVQTPFPGNNNSTIWGMFTAKSTMNSALLYWGLINKNGEIEFIGYDNVKNNVAPLADMLNRLLNSPGAIDNKLLQDFIDFFSPTTTTTITSAQKNIWRVLETVQSVAPGRYFTQEQWYRLMIRALAIHLLDVRGRFMSHEWASKAYTVFANALEANIPTSMQEYLWIMYPTRYINYSDLDFIADFEKLNFQDYFRVVMAVNKLTDAQIESMMTPQKVVNLDNATALSLMVYEGFEMLLNDVDAKKLLDFYDRLFRIYNASPNRLAFDVPSSPVSQASYVLNVDFINRLPVDLRLKIVNYVVDQVLAIPTVNPENSYFRASFVEDLLKLNELSNVLTNDQQLKIKAYLEFAYKGLSDALKADTFVKGKPGREGYVEPLIRIAKILKRYGIEKDLRWLITALNYPFAGSTNLPAETVQDFNKRIDRFVRMWKQYGVVIKDQGTGATSYNIISENSLYGLDGTGSTVLGQVSIIDFSPINRGNFSGEYDSRLVTIYTGVWSPGLQINNWTQENPFIANGPTIAHEGGHGLRFDKDPSSGTVYYNGLLRKLWPSQAPSGYGRANNDEWHAEAVRIGLRSETFNSVFLNPLLNKTVYAGHVGVYMNALRILQQPGNNGKMMIPLQTVVVVKHTNDLGGTSYVQEYKSKGRIEINGYHQTPVITGGLISDFTYFESNDMQMRVKITYKDHLPTHVLIVDVTGKVILDQDLSTEEGSTIFFLGANSQSYPIDVPFETNTFEQVLNKIVTAVADYKGGSFDTDGIIRAVEEESGVLLTRAQRLKVWNAVVEIRKSDNPAKTALAIVEQESIDRRKSGTKANAAMFVPATAADKVQVNGGIDLSNLIKELDLKQGDTMLDKIFDDKRIGQLKSLTGFIPRIENISNVNLNEILEFERSF